MTPRAKATKAKISEWDHLRLKMSEWDHLRLKTHSKGNPEPKHAAAAY